MSLKITRRRNSEIFQIEGSIAGRRIRESTGTADRSLAEKFRAHRENEIYSAALYGKRPEVAWATAVADYTLRTSPSPGTARMLLRLTHHFGRMNLSEIDQVAIDRACDTLCAADAAPATRLRNVIGPTRAVMLHAHRRKWCDAPAFEVPKGAMGERRLRWLTPAEFIALRDAAAPHLRPLMVFLVCTGARLGEALTLQWGDVDLHHARATIRGVKDRHSATRDRIIDLSPAAVAALATIAYPVPAESVRDARGVARRRYRYVIRREGSVFRTQAGEAYEDRGKEAGGQIKTGWAGACRRAGLPGEWKQDSKGHRWWVPEDVTPHVLRHTYATWHYCLHRDLLRLKEDGDWSSASQVERYAKVAPPAMAADIRAIFGTNPPPPSQMTA